MSGSLFWQEHTSQMSLSPNQPNSIDKISNFASQNTGVAHLLLPWLVGLFTRQHRLTKTLRQWRTNNCCALWEKNTIFATELWLNKTDWYLSYNGMFLDCFFFLMACFRWLKNSLRLTLSTAVYCSASVLVLFLASPNWVVVWHLLQVTHGL